MIKVLRWLFGDEGLPFKVDNSLPNPFDDGYRFFKKGLDNHHQKW